MMSPNNPSSFRIITADERLKETRGIKGVLTGISGIGKTSQLWTLDADRTLFVNLEAGELAVQGWPGDEVRVRDWERARDLAAWIGGPNPAMRDDQAYSQKDYERVCRLFGDPSLLDKYDTIFVDSISVASRICMQWCKGQPQVQSDRNGKLDLRGAYGLLGQEMIGWLTHLQHTRAKNVWFVGILDEKLDDFNRKVFVPQIDGAKTGLELPGIVDEVLTMTELADAEKRALELKLRIDNLRMFIDNESGLTAVGNRGAVGPQDDTVEISMGGVSKTVSFSAALKFAGFIQRLA